MEEIINKKLDELDQREFVVVGFSSVLIARNGVAWGKIAPEILYF